MKDEVKSIYWLGDSRERLRNFSVEARSVIGYQLELAQRGLQPSDWKPMPSIGSGVIEIRVRAEGEFRVFYVAKFERVIYVLHVFMKKTRKTSSLDVELGKKRYREVQKRL